MDEIESALNLTQRNKAGVVGGGGGGGYEHLVYGSPLLYDVLSRYFNAVIRVSYA